MPPTPRPPKMPAKSASQRRLMAAAEHGATFAKAKQLRKSMTHAQLHDFAATKESKLPEHTRGNRYADRLRGK